jgi:hypothetical protein
MCACATFLDCTIKFHSRHKKVHAKWTLPLPPSKIAHKSFVDVETHLLLTDYTHIPLNYLLVSNVTLDALHELLEVLKEIRINSILCGRQFDGQLQ